MKIILSVILIISGILMADTIGLTTFDKLSEEMLLKKENINTKKTSREFGKSKLVILSGKTIEFDYTLADHVYKDTYTIRSSINYLKGTGYSFYDTELDVVCAEYPIGYDFYCFVSGKYSWTKTNRYFFNIDSSGKITGKYGYTSSHLLSNANSELRGTVSGYASSSSSSSSASSIANPFATPTSTTSNASDCNTKAMSHVIFSGWFLIGTSDSGCTVEGLKEKGASYVYAYENGSWVTEGAINPSRGFWVKK